MFIIMLLECIEKYEMIMYWCVTFYYHSMIEILFRNMLTLLLFSSLLPFSLLLQSLQLMIMRKVMVVTK